MRGNSALLETTEASNWCRQLRRIPAGRPALFLDRDGVIIEDTGYVSDFAEIALLPGASDAIRRMNRAGWPVVVVSNQSGLGRGYFDFATLKAVQSCVEARLTLAGARIDAALICGAPPWDCGPPARWRKPSPGMFLAAREFFGINLPGSVMVGDRATDMMAAQRAGVNRRILLTEPDGCRLGAATDIARDLLAAVRLIAGQGPASALD